jgi:hypothetical protein
VAHPDLYNSSGTTIVSPAVAAAPYNTGSGVLSPKVNFFLPGEGNFDTALFKNWPFAEGKATAQLRVETYNTFNHTEFNAVNATATFQNAIQSGSNPQTATNFGQKSGADNPRYMQLALRISF